MGSIAASVGAGGVGFVASRTSELSLGPQGMQQVQMEKPQCHSCLYQSHQLMAQAAPAIVSGMWLKMGLIRGKGPPRRKQAPQGSRLRRLIDSTAGSKRSPPRVSPAHVLMRIAVESEGARVHASPGLEPSTPLNSILLTAWFSLG